MTNFLKEPSQCLFVNISEIRGVNSLESSSDAESLEFLKILLQLLKFKLEIDFHGKEDCHLTFN